MDEENKQGEVAEGSEGSEFTPKKGRKTPKRSESGKSEKKESLFAEVRAEFKKIVWPGRTELLKQTATVIVVSLMFGAVIFLMDAAFGFGLNTFIDNVILG